MAENWREIEAEWQGGGAFIGRNATGGTVQIGKMDDRPGVGPMELILVGLAGCTGVDIVDILAKKREKITAFKVKVRGKSAEDFPKIFNEIQVTYLIWGVDINPISVEKAIKLSEEKYCSVSLMLKPVAEIRSNYRIFASNEPEKG